MPSDPEHPIGVVVRRTGLTSHVIRAWERRYGAVSPHRTDGNQRLYSEADVQRLALLNKVVSTGRSIGQIAQLPEEKLLDYLRQDGPAYAQYPSVSPDNDSPRGSRSEAATGTDPTQSMQTESSFVSAFVGGGNGSGKSGKPSAGDAETRDLVASCLRAVEQFDAQTLEREIERASTRVGRLGVIENVVLPLVEQIGESWHGGRLRMVHEHMAVAVIRTYMGALINTFRPPASAPRAVAATPIHQIHELGALAAALSAAAEGWQVTYLGPGVPSEEIAKASEYAGADAVLLSILLPEHDLQLENEILTLRNLLSDEIRIILAGQAPDSFVESVAGKRIEIRSGLADLRLSLRPAPNRL